MTSPPSPTSEARPLRRRELQAVQTRQRILDTALALWATKGFEATTVAEVCRTAKVSTGTFYAYFNRKEDALLELARVTESHARDVWEQLEGTDASTASILGQLVTTLARGSARTEPELLQPLIRELIGVMEPWPALNDDGIGLQHTLTNVFRRGQTRGEVSKSIDPRELASMTAVLALHGMVDWLRLQSEDLECILARRVDVLLEGFGTRASTPQRPLMQARTVGGSGPDDLGSSEQQRLET